MYKDETPPVRYDATAQRPTFEQLPPYVREEIVCRLGGIPTTINSAGGGFTGGFAARVGTGSGRDMFIKAAGPDLPFVLNAYRAESSFNAALPEGVPAPRLLFTSDIEDWIVSGFEAVDGTALRLPISGDGWDLMLRAWAQAAEWLTPAPQSLLDLGLKPMAPDEFRFFTAIEAGEVELKGFRFLWEKIPWLAEMEKGLVEALDRDAVTHGDLRPDNMILGHERAWICDWTVLQHSAPWFDTVGFLIVAQGDGCDADKLFWQHPTSDGVEPEELDAVLAGILGYYAYSSEKPPVDQASPHLRAHQRWNAMAAYEWLTRRRGR